MGPNGVANRGSYTMRSYRDRVVWLLPGPGGRSQPCDASGTILGHGRRGAYLCTVRALVFEGSILVYNPTMNEAEWVPVCSLANDLSWAKESSAVALANYVPCVPAEAAQIARLRASRIVSCPGNDSSTSAEEEEVQHSDTQSTNPPMDTDPKVGDESEDGAGGQTDLEDAAERNQQWHPQNWEAIMEEAE